MTWIAPVATAADLEGVLAHRPALLERYRDMIAALWSDSGLSPRLLELVRLRVGYVHDAAAELAVRDPRVPLSAAELADLAAGRCDRFAPDEQAALAVAELMPYAHGQVCDADVARLSSAFGHRGCVALLVAIAFFDVNCRLKLVLDIPVQTAALDPKRLI